MHQNLRIYEHWEHLALTLPLNRPQRVLICAPSVRKGGGCLQGVREIPQLTSLLLFASSQTAMLAIKSATARQATEMIGGEYSMLFTVPHL